MDAIRILLADDHPAVRAQIRKRLAHEPDFAIVGEADCSASAVDCARELKPDIVLIDPMMQDGLGLNATRQIAALSQATAVVVLTAFSDTAQTIELRRAGTRHILNKGIESSRLVEVLRGIAGSRVPQ
ncbi:MAG: response regulator transcription factor [Rudaea sp.]